MNFESLSESLGLSNGNSIPSQSANLRQGGAAGQAVGQAQTTSQRQQTPGSPGPAVVLAPKQPIPTIVWVVIGLVVLSVAIGWAKPHVSGFIGGILESRNSHSSAGPSPVTESTLTPNPSASTAAPDPIESTPTQSPVQSTPPRVPTGGESVSNDSWELEVLDVDFSVPYSPNDLSSRLFDDEKIMGVKVRISNFIDKPFNDISPITWLLDAGNLGSGREASFVNRAGQFKKEEKVDPGESAEGWVYFGVNNDAVKAELRLVNWDVDLHDWDLEVSVP